MWDVGMILFFHQHVTSSLIYQHPKKMVSSPQAPFWCAVHTHIHTDATPTMVMYVNLQMKELTVALTHRNTFTDITDIPHTGDTCVLPHEA